HAAESEGCGGSEQKHDVGFGPPRSQQRTSNRSKRHGRCQQSVLARSGMKDADRHRCDKYWEVQSERADQKQHDEHRLKRAIVLFSGVGAAWLIASEGWAEQGSGEVNVQGGWARKERRRRGGAPGTIHATEDAVWFMRYRAPSLLLSRGGV